MICICQCDGSLPFSSCGGAAVRATEGAVDLTFQRYSGGVFGRKRPDLNGFGSSYGVGGEAFLCVHLRECSGWWFGCTQLRFCFARLAHVVVYLQHKRVYFRVPLIRTTKI